jgi:hypothetical protein
VVNPTKAKILETMAPTPSTLKLRKVSPNTGERLRVVQDEDEPQRIPTMKRIQL